ncbi:type II toxin-antitoxin system VapC family toxin [Mesorhizobium sp. VK9D]|uniref:type II toxin-antitoxin system VapC family toxin n=1 Tax=Mesorhizobium australafricanum TaxID=3072311 RepID=UPI002A23C131|nr:type II toxin-antitoxin system VapC family toxin [Mesorhizobium sp. VK9D]MDX8454511.1 type II toxin-antitoxin system VapC family toxin [Mesorhizobium sp. VK9D]
MIAVDTSALMAIVLDEPAADACIAVLEAEDDLVISAGTVAELLIVAARRGVGEEIRSLLDGLGFEITPVTESTARRVAEAYAQWGKGIHAALNFGDCFAYEVAKDRACRLLYIGDDFSKTDIEGAI